MKTVRNIVVLAMGFLGGLVGAVIWFTSVMAGYYRKVEENEQPRNSEQKDSCIKVRVARRI